MKELKKIEFQEEHFQAEGVLGFPKVSMVFHEST